MRRFRPQLEPWKKTLYITFVAQLITALGFSSMFPFLPFYVEQLGSVTHTSTEILAGWVYSAQSITMMLTSPIWGVLADRFGRKLMVQRATFGGAIIILLMAFVRSAEELILLRAVQGIITGTVAANNALIASIVPKKQSGYAMGMLQVSLGAGVALGPLLGGALADAYGYRSAFYVTSAMLFLSGLMIHFGIQENFDRASVRATKNTSYIHQLKEILAPAGVVAAYGLRFLTTLGRMMIVPIAPLFVAMLLPDKENLNTYTGLVVSSASFTLTLSSVYLGKLGDKIGHRKIILICLLFAASLYLPYSLVEQPWQLIVLQALVGVAMGGIIPSVSALLLVYSTRGKEGAVYGLDNSILSAGSAVAPLIGSWVAVSMGLNATFFATALVLYISLAVAAVFLPRRKTVAMDPQPN